MPRYCYCWNANAALYCYCWNATAALLLLLHCYTATQNAEAALLSLYNCHKLLCTEREGRATAAEESTTILIFEDAIRNCL